MASSTYSADELKANHADPTAESGPATAGIATSSVRIEPSAHHLDLEVTVRSDVLVVVRRPIEPRASRGSVNEPTNLRVRLDGDFVVIGRDIAVTEEVRVDADAPEVALPEPNLANQGKKKEG